MKTTRSWMSVCLFFLGLCLAGCQRPHPPVQPPPATLMIPKADLDTAWDETIDVLREHYFIPDRQDRRAGLIVTYPTVSKQWFEFWRDDAQGWYDVTESSISATRRTVRVQFKPAGDEFEITMAVFVQRKNEPGRQITTASGTIMAFRDTTPTYSGEKISHAESVTWVDIGKDQKLANYLLDRLQRRLPEAQEKID